MQRRLYSSFRDAIKSSHKGVALDESLDGVWLDFFRIVLYSCDRPEEPAVLCLKAGKCGHPCSTCDVLAVDACTVKGTEGALRVVLDTLEEPVAVTALSRANKKPPRRIDLESKHSTSAFIPAFACPCGQTTAPHYLYRMIAFSPLHVRSSCLYACFVQLRVGRSVRLMTWVK